MNNNTNIHNSDRNWWNRSYTNVFDGIHTTNMLFFPPRSFVCSLSCFSLIHERCSDWQLILGSDFFSPKMETHFTFPNFFFLIFSSKSIRSILLFTSLRFLSLAFSIRPNKRSSSFDRSTHLSKLFHSHRFPMSIEEKRFLSFVNPKIKIHFFSLAKDFLSFPLSLRISFLFQHVFRQECVLFGIDRKTSCPFKQQKIPMRQENSLQIGI